MSGASDPNSTGSHQGEPAAKRSKHLPARILGWQEWDRIGRILEVLGSFGGLVVAIVALYIASDATDIHNAVSNLSTLAYSAAHQVDAANNQLKIMQAEQRPWLKIEPEISHDLVIAKSDLTVGAVNVLMNFKLTNTGKTPAFLVVPISDSDDMQGRDIAAWQANACDKFRTDKKAKLVSTVETVFPGQHIDMPMGIQVTPEQIREVIAFKSHLYKEPISEQGFRPAIFGCINYRSGLDSDWHQTWFVYFVAPKRGGPRSDFAPIPQTVKIKNMEIWADPVGSRAFTAN